MSQEMDLPCSKTIPTPPKKRKRKKDLLEIVAPTYYIVGEITIIVLFCFFNHFFLLLFLRGFVIFLFPNQPSAVQIKTTNTCRSSLL